MSFIPRLTPFDGSETLALSDELATCRAPRIETPFEDEDDDEYENDTELFDDPGG